MRLNACTRYASTISVNRMLLLMVVVTSIGSMLVAQDYKNTIVSTDFDIIKAEDPSCFTKLEYQGIKSAEMPDKTRDRELFHDAYVFVAHYSDNTKIEFALDRGFDSSNAAEQEAILYATRLGKLPSVLRSGVKRLVVHQGNENATAFSDHGLIVVYAGNARKRIQTNDLEETLFHESVHAAWDKQFAQSTEWKRAQASDGTFVSLYAKENPRLEDLAESALFAFAVIHHLDRLPVDDAQRIQKQIPARILFVEKLIPKGKSMFFDVVKSSSKK